MSLAAFATRGSTLSRPTTKSVEYAYPSSPNATKFGFGRTGCYVVNIIHGNQPPLALAGFATLDEAHAHAFTLEYPYDRFTR